MSDYATIECTWMENDSQETSINFNAEFMELDGISKKYFLKDVIWELQQIYDKTNIFENLQKTEAKKP